MAATSHGAGDTLGAVNHLSSQRRCGLLGWCEQQKPLKQLVVAFEAANGRPRKQDPRKNRAKPCKTA